MEGDLLTSRPGSAGRTKCESSEFQQSRAVGIDSNPLTPRVSNHHPQGSSNKKKEVLIPLRPTHAGGHNAFQTSSGSDDSTSNQQTFAAHPGFEQNQSRYRQDLHQRQDSGLWDVPHQPQLHRRQSLHGQGEPSHLAAGSDTLLQSTRHNATYAGAQYPMPGARNPFNQLAGHSQTGDEACDDPIGVWQNHTGFSPPYTPRRGAPQLLPPTASNGPDYTVQQNGLAGQGRGKHTQLVHNANPNISSNVRPSATHAAFVSCEEYPDDDMTDSWGQPPDSSTSVPGHQQPQARLRPFQTSNDNGEQTEQLTCPIYQNRRRPTLPPSTSLRSTPTPMPQPPAILNYSNGYLGSPATNPELRPSYGQRLVGAHIIPYQNQGRIRQDQRASMYPSPMPQDPATNDHEGENANYFGMTPEQQMQEASASSSTPQLPARRFPGSHIQPSPTFPSPRTGRVQLSTQRSLPQPQPSPESDLYAPSGLETGSCGPRTGRGVSNTGEFGVGVQRPHLVSGKSHVSARPKRVGSGSSESDDAESTKHETRGPSTKAPPTKKTRTATRSTQTGGTNLHGEVHRHQDGLLYFRGRNSRNWEPTINHEAHRRALIQDMAQHGSYAHRPTAGPNPNDVTSYLPAQRLWRFDGHWDPSQDHILYRFERGDLPTPEYVPGPLRWRGQVALTNEDVPVTDWHNMPLTISSMIEGGRLEQIHREDRRITTQDFRDRQPSRSGDRPLQSPSALGNRRVKFRELNGLVAWDPREGSQYLNAMVRSHLSEDQIRQNTTRGFNGLTQAEIHSKTMRNAISGHFMKRAGKRALPRGETVRRVHKARAVKSRKRKQDKNSEDEEDGNGEDDDRDQA